MSGMMNKVKNALHSDKKTPEAAAANQGNNGTASYSSAHFPIPLN